jgi:hypothetical protein
VAVDPAELGQFGNQGYGSRNLLPLPRLFAGTDDLAPQLFCPVFGVCRGACRSRRITPTMRPSVNPRTCCTRASVIFGCLLEPEAGGTTRPRACFITIGPPRSYPPRLTNGLGSASASPSEELPRHCHSARQRVKPSLNS